MHPINIKDLYKTEIFRKTIEVEYGFNRIDNSQEPDKGMIDILNLHGFNELPKVVPDNDFDKLLISGEYIQLWRGFPPYTRNPAEGFESLKYGELVIFRGEFGSGIYTTCGENGLDTAWYGYADTGGIVGTMLFPKNSNVVKYHDIEKQHDDFLTYVYDKEKFLKNEETSDEYKNYRAILWLFNDIGRFAAYIGYEGIYIEKLENSEPYIRYFLIFNRGNLIIRDTPEPSPF